MQTKQLAVLVVEDDALTATALGTLLRRWGHLPVIAPDAAAALRQVQDQTPDVVLLDIGLPDMDGFELAKVFRTRWAYKPPVLIAVTGHGTTEDRHRSNQAGIDLHLLKPIDPEELAYLLAQCQKAAAPTV